MTPRDFMRPAQRGVKVLMSTHPPRGGIVECPDGEVAEICRSACTACCCSEDTYNHCPTHEQTFRVGDARNEP
jgi:hypothetical protein